MSRFQGQTLVQKVGDERNAFLEEYRSDSQAHAERIFTGFRSSKKPRVRVVWNAFHLIVLCMVVSTKAYE